MPKGIKFASHADRILANIEIDPDTDCWNWLSSLSEGGYGQVCYGLGKRGHKRTDYAHRLAYETFVGEIPAGLQLDHLCRNRACCNPAHLEPVTPRENIRRSPVHPSVIAAAATHCKYGHEFTEENTCRFASRPERRRCRACANEAARRYRARRALRAAGIERAA